MDSSGNLFIADQFNHRIRKVDTSGIITTVAGTGTDGFSGDGGPATNAQLDGPTGVAVDSSGNLFIADEGNERIRKVNTSGNISTVAGDGTDGFSGDGGPATSAQLDRPKAVAVDSIGNLFIVDQLNNRIRKVDTSGNISTVAGGGSGGLGDGSAATSAQLGGPQGVAVDSSGNVFIGDTSNDRVRKVAAAPRTDLAVTMTDLPDPIHTGNNLTYSITITNNGPNTANSVIVTDTLPSGVTFVSATPGQGSCSGTSAVTCNLGTLANGATATVTIVTTVTATSGSFSNTASVSATEDDPTSGNDSATANTSILAPGAIPSLSTGGLVALSVLMAVAGLVMLRRRSVRRA